MAFTNLGDGVSQMTSRSLASDCHRWWVRLYLQRSATDDRIMPCPCARARPAPRGGSARQSSRHARARYRARGETGISRRHSRRLQKCTHSLGGGGGERLVLLGLLLLLLGLLSGGKVVGNGALVLGVEEVVGLLLALVETLSGGSRVLLLVSVVLVSLGAVRRE